MYLFLQQPICGIAEEGSKNLGQGQTELRNWLCVHCMRTAVIKGLSWLLYVGSSLTVLCSFRCPAGKKRYFCGEQWSAVSACCAAREPHTAVSVWSWSILGCCRDCLEFHGLFFTSLQMLWPLPEEATWCWFGPCLSCYGLSLKKKPGVLRIHEGGWQERVLPAFLYHSASSLVWLPHVWKWVTSRILPNPLSQPCSGYAWLGLSIDWIDLAKYIMRSGGAKW